MMDHTTIPVDPSHGSSFAGAIEWIATALTGSAATVIAILAVAALGALLIAGRLPTRRAGEVVIGCFVLFSARVIAGALLGPVQQIAPPLSQAAAAPLPYVPTMPKPIPYDPYAGASVPTIIQNHPLIK